MSILNVHATKTDSAGNGYYRASDGYYYYGNAQNGYLVETEETKRRKAAQAAQNTSRNSSAKNAGVSSASQGTGNPLLDMLAFKAGAKLGGILVNIVWTVIPFLFKAMMVFGVLPAMATDYLREFLFYGNMGYRFGYKLLSLLGLIGIISFIAYGIYRKINGLKSIARLVFWGEALCLTGIYYLNMQGAGTSIMECILYGTVIAYSIKVFSVYLEKIVYFLYKKCMQANKQGGKRK